MTYRIVRIFKILGPDERNPRQIRSPRADLRGRVTYALGCDYTELDTAYNTVYIRETNPIQMSEAFKTSVPDNPPSPNKACRQPSLLEAYQSQEIASQYTRYMIAHEDQYVSVITILFIHLKSRAFSWFAFLVMLAFSATLLIYIFLVDNDTQHHRRALLQPAPYCVSICLLSSASSASSFNDLLISLEELDCMYHLRLS